MAKEIKSISVSPSAEENTINLWQSFGWELKSTQEIKTQDVQVYTGQASDGTKFYETKKGEHYIKLTFERDPSMQNYAELSTLWEKYKAKPNVPEAPKHCPDKPKQVGVGCFVLSILSIVLGVGFISGFATGEVGMGFFGIILLFIGINKIMSRRKYSKKCAEWEIENAQYETALANWREKKNEYEDFMKITRPEIIKRAKELL